MKKILNISLMLLLTAVFCASAVIAGTIANPNNETYIKVGTKLVYAINKGSEKYDVTVTITSLAPNLSFDWKESEPRQGKGSITMTPAAIDHAAGMISVAMDNAMTLDKETAIWLSNALWNKLSTEGRLEMTIDGKLTPVKVTHNDEPIAFIMINGIKTQVSTKTLHNGYMDTSKKMLTFLDSKDFPILLKLDFGWTMTLKSITN